MQKAQKGKRGKMPMVALALLLLAILALSVNIKTITITGNKRFTQEQMTEMLFPDQLSRNFLFCYFHIPPAICKF